MALSFPLGNKSMETVVLTGIDATPAPSWSVVSGGTTVSPQPGGLSAEFFAADTAGDVTVVTVTFSKGGTSGTTTVTCTVFEDAAGGTGDPGFEISAPAPKV